MSWLTRRECVMVDELVLPLAEWELGLLAPECVPEPAVAALERGCEANEVAVLAGLNRPLRGEVEAELAGLLRRVGVARPSRAEALKIVVDARARAIVDGALSPADGAHELWRLANDFWGDEVVRDQLVVFVGLASEWDDHPDWRTSYEVQIVEAARALQMRGGLRLG
jgi:hypothetical protein